MSRIELGVNTGVAPTAHRWANTNVILLIAVILGGCSSKTPEEPTPQSNSAADSQRTRYIEACTREEAFRKDKRTQLAACECVFDAARKRLTDVQMELLIAIRARDKNRQAQVRAQAEYSEASFKANMSGFGQETVACVVGKSG